MHNMKKAIVISLFTLMVSSIVASLAMGFSATHGWTTTQPDCPTCDVSSHNFNDHAFTFGADELFMTQTEKGMLNSFVAVQVIHKNGKATGYEAASDTDTARGIALLNAIAASVTGDIITAASNTFDMGTSGLVPKPYTVLRGQGRGKTNILSSVDQINGGVLTLASGLIVENLTISGMLTVSGGAGWQTIIGIPDSGTGAAPTDFIVRNVEGFGDSDCVFFRGSATGTIKGKFIDCAFNGKYNAVNIQRNAADNSSVNDVLDFYNCTANAAGPSNGGGSRGFSNQSKGLCRYYGGVISESSGTSVNYGVYQVGSGRTELYGVSISSDMGTNAWDIIKTGGSVLATGCTYSANKVSGTIEAVKTDPLGDSFYGTGYNIWFGQNARIRMDGSNLEINPDVRGSGFTIHSGTLLVADEENLGNNLVQNALFNTCPPWAPTTGWDCFANKMNHILNGTTPVSIVVSGFTIGNTYRASTDIVSQSGSSGTVTLSIPGVTTFSSYNFFSGVGTHTETFVATATTHTFVYTPSNTAQGSFDNVVVQEVILGSNIFTGGDFASLCAGWVMGPDWVCGSAQADHYTDGTGIIYHAITGLSIGSPYRLDYQTIAYGGQTGMGYSGFDVTTLSSTFNFATNATWTADFTAAATDDSLNFIVDAASARGAIANITVKAITYGSNLVTNGTINTSVANWTVPSGWSMSDGKAFHSSNGTGALTQVFTDLTPNWGYILSFATGTGSTTIGTVYPQIDGVNKSSHTWIADTAGSIYTESFLSTGTTCTVSFVPGTTGSRGSIYLPTLQKMGLGNNIITSKITNISGTAGKVKCFKADLSEGYCSDAPTGSGGCTCN